MQDFCPSARLSVLFHNNYSLLTYMNWNQATVILEPEAMHGAWSRRAECQDRDFLAWGSTKSWQDAMNCADSALHELSLVADWTPLKKHIYIAGMCRPRTVYYAASFKLRKSPWYSIHLRKHKIPLSKKSQLQGKKAHIAIAIKSVQILISLVSHASTPRRSQPQAQRAKVKE